MKLELTISIIDNPFRSLMWDIVAKFSRRRFLLVMDPTADGTKTILTTYSSWF
jgi:hypothetical protein